MSWEIGTWVVLIVTAIGLIVWDIVVYVQGRGETKAKATISRRILRFSQRHIVLPFAFGVLMGHFFWPQPIDPCEPPEPAAEAK